MADEGALLQRKLRDAYRAYSGPKSSRPSSIRLPIGVSEATGAPYVTINRLNEDTVEYRMTAQAVYANVQEDKAAFESWIIALKVWLGQSHGVANVVLSWELPTKTKIDGVTTSIGQHYERFLFRVHSFRKMYRPWFSIDRQCEGELTTSEAINSKALWLNVESKRRDKATASTKAEYVLENGLVASTTFRASMQLADGYPRRQLPVGLFRQDKPANKAKVFPGGGSAIDMIGVNRENEFIVFELKAEKYKPAGALSELLLYTSLMREVADATRRVKFAEQHEWAQDVQNCAAVKGILLADQFHPLLEHRELVETLNEGARAAWGREKPVSFDRIQVDREKWLRPSP